MSQIEDAIAPMGMVRVIGFDSFSSEAWRVGDYDSLQEALDKTKHKAGEMTLMYYYDSYGVLLERHGSY